MEEDEGKANSSKTIDRSGNTAFDSEAKQKASFRQELKGKPRLWVIVVIVVIVVVIIVSMCPTTYVARPSVGIVEESPIINLSTKGVKPVTQADLDRTVARYKALSLVTACRDEYAAHLKDTTEKDYRIYRSDSASDDNEPEFSEVMQAELTEGKAKEYKFHWDDAIASTGLTYSNYQISCSVLLNRSVADVLREIDSSIAVPSGSDRLIRQIVRQWIDEAGKPYLKPADVARVLTDEVINRVKLKPFDQQTAPVQFVGYINWLKEVRECFAENSLGLGTCVEDGVNAYYKFDHGSTLCTNSQGKYDIRAVYLEKGSATMVDSMRNGAIFYLPAHVENSTDSAQYSVTCDKAYRKLNETFKDYVLGINAGVDKLGEKLGEPYCHELRGPIIHYGIPPEKNDCRQR